MTSTRTSKQNGTSRLRLPLWTLALVLAGGCAAPLEGMEKEIKPADLEARKTIGAKAAGLVVWTSSRDGLPHIYSMRTDGSDVRQLTKGDFTDWHPRISPDGTKILFSRSRAAGFVREAEANTKGAWDLYTIEVGGGEPIEVATDATWGSWAAPDQIVFVRGTKIMREKLGRNEPRVIVDTARYGLFDGSVVQQPEESHDGHFLALTLNGKHREAGIWNIKKKTWTEMGSGGAQIAWAPDGASVYWADDDGKDGSRIAREAVVAGTQADDRDPSHILLVDLGGKRSRERFPRLSNYGKWLVFAAAVSSLENDIEDYELFLWEAGSTPSSATRLTFHSANDRWPDIFIGEPGKAQPPASAPEAADTKEGEGEAPAGEAEKASQGEKATPAAEGEGCCAEKANDAEKQPAASGGGEEAPDESAAPPAAAAKPKGKKKKHH
jgi:hypothetical protein